MENKIYQLCEKKILVTLGDFLNKHGNQGPENQFPEVHLSKEVRERQEVDQATLLHMMGEFICQNFAYIVSTIAYVI